MEQQSIEFEKALAQLEVLIPQLHFYPGFDTSLPTLLAKDDK